MLLMNRELCIKLVNEIILYYDARSKKTSNWICLATFPKVDYTKFDDNLTNGLVAHARSPADRQPYDFKISPFCTSYRVAKKCFNHIVRRLTGMPTKLIHLEKDFPKFCVDIDMSLLMQVYCSKE